MNSGSLLLENQRATETRQSCQIQCWIMDSRLSNYGYFVFFIRFHGQPEELASFRYLLIKHSSWQVVCANRSIFALCTVPQSSNILQPCCGFKLRKQVITPLVHGILIKVSTVFVPRKYRWYLVQHTVNLDNIDLNFLPQSWSTAHRHGQKIRLILLLLPRMLEVLTSLASP